MSCSKCSKPNADEFIGTGGFIQAYSYALVLRASEAAALPSEYVIVSEHWDPGFRSVMPRNGAKFILVDGVCDLSSVYVATVLAIDGTQWKLCRPMDMVALNSGGSPTHVNWASDKGTTGPYASRQRSRYGTGAVTMTSIAMAESGGWSSASSTNPQAPIYFVGGRRARIRIGNVVEVRRVTAVANGGPTGLLVKLGPIVRPFGSGGTGCIGARIKQLQGTGGGCPASGRLTVSPELATGGRYGGKYPMPVAYYGAGTGAAPSRSRHLHRRRR